MRRAARRDLNEREIIDALESRGCVVQQVSARGFPDLVCYRAATGLLRLIEVKQRAGKLTEAQAARFPEWPAWVCRTKEQAFEAMGIKEAA